MSAVNILLQADVAVVFTDSKATTAEGVQFNTVKFAALPWMRTVVAVRGYAGALRVFERLISQNATTYDRAVQFLVERFADVLAADYIDPTEAFAMKQDLDVYIVGWGINGPDAHWVSNYRTAGQVQRVDGCHVSPVPDRESQQAFARDVKAGFQRLMADQAAQNVGVGGWMMATEIHENHITSYPLGGLCGLSSVASQKQPAADVEALAAIDVANADRAARLAAVTTVG